MNMVKGLAIGTAAGAAGTTALNAATYVDMAVRGRPSSSTPQKTVEVAADKANVSIPGDDETRSNRVSGLGPLAGLATGLGVGAAMGLARSLGWRPALGVSAVTAGVAAMAGSSLPMAALGVTDPRRWSANDWISDLVPHLAFGMALGWTLDQLTRP